MFSDKNIFVSPMYNIISSVNKDGFISSFLINIPFFFISPAKFLSIILKKWGIVDRFLSFLVSLELLQFFSLFSMMQAVGFSYILLLTFLIFPKGRGTLDFYLRPSSELLSC